MGAISRGPDGPAWSQTLACPDAPCTGTGRSHDRPFGNCRRSASGRRGAAADDARSREVRLCHSSWEADEQCGPDRSGAGGAKGGGRGECDPAKHWPGTKRDQPCHKRRSAYGEPPSAPHRHSPREPCAGIPLARSERGAVSNGRPYLTSDRVSSHFDPGAALVSCLGALLHDLCHHAAMALTCEVGVASATALPLSSSTNRTGAALQK